MGFGAWVSVQGSVIQSLVFFFLFVAGFRDDTSRSRNSLMVQHSQTRKENILSEIDIEAAPCSKPLIP